MRVNSINCISKQYFFGKKTHKLEKHDVFTRAADDFGYSSIINKYALKPDDIEIKSIAPINITNEQKAIFIEKILEAHELAKKNVDTGNITGLGFATNICLSDDSWHLATNFNNTRNDISSICGERSAVIVAYNDFLKKLLRSPFGNLKQNDFKVKYLAMSSAKELGRDNNASSPCADCLSWLNTTKFFDDDTKIVFLTKDEQNEKFYLEFRTLKEILPMRGKDAVDSIFNTENSTLDSFVISKDAKRIMEEKKIQIEDIIVTIKKAKDIFEDKTNFTPYSEQKIGACIKTGDKFYCAPKIDWSKRWFVEPVEFAIAKSIENLSSLKMPDVIAYYGDNDTVCQDSVEQDGIVSIKTLGRIKSLDKNAEPLIVVINDNDEIEVNSINDFMPKDFAFHQAYIK